MEKVMEYGVKKGNFIDFCGLDLIESGSKVRFERVG
jgi:hypothetical protein